MIPVASRPELATLRERMVCRRAELAPPFDSACGQVLGSALPTRLCAGAGISIRGYNERLLAVARGADRAQIRSRHSALWQGSATPAAVTH